MKRFATLLILGFILCSNVANAEVPLDESNSWAFAAPHDDFTDAALDLRLLNEC